MSSKGLIRVGAKARRCVLGFWLWFRFWVGFRLEVGIWIGLCLWFRVNLWPGFWIRFWFRLRVGWGFRFRICFWEVRFGIGLVVEHPSYAALVVLLQGFLGGEPLCQDSSFAITREQVSVGHCVHFCLQGSESLVEPGLARGGGEAPVAGSRQTPVTSLATHCQVDPTNTFWDGGVHPRDVILSTPNTPSHYTSLHIYMCPFSRKSLYSSPAHMSLVVVCWGRPEVHHRPPCKYLSPRSRLRRGTSRPAWTGFPACRSNQSATIDHHLKQN